MIQSFKGMSPVIDPSSYVHPLATVIGHVTIGKECYIGPGAVLRGDWGAIELADGCNVQENCVVHLFPGTTVRLGEEAHIGHGAIVHGAQVGAHTLVGMHAVLMDDVVLGDGCIVGALTFLRAKSVWEPRSLIVGNPGQIKGHVSDEMLAHKKEGTALYRTLPAEMIATANLVEPFASDPGNRPTDFPDYETWQNRKS
jgi:carbonic anhydrase/acetyltransferase-like protein (isoleucine patch superfamily)